MKYPFLASFLVFCAVFFYRNRKTSRIHEKAKQAYFDREAEANNTRKQPLDNLEYICIPIDTLPMDLCSDDATIAECMNDILQLQQDDIVNFTGLTNTDLKLQYGPANLPYLQKCDSCYTHLVRVLNNWGTALYKLGHIDEALVVFEYAISIKADVSSIYFTTADIYIDKNAPYKINNLIAVAEQLNTVLSDSIVRTLKSKLP